MSTAKLTLSCHDCCVPDMQEHYKMGVALSPLRAQNVLLLGSGMSFHNMQKFVRSDRPGQMGGGSKALPGKVSRAC